MPRKAKSKPPNPHYKLAKYIIGKFVDARVVKANLPRELVLTYKLTKKYDSIYFWRGLDCHFKVKSMLVFFGEAAKKKLKYEWDMYQARLKLHKKIKVEKQSAPPDNLETVEIENPVDLARPKLIYDFLNE